MEWNFETLKNLYSVTSVAYLVPVRNLTPHGSPLDNFDTRLTKIIGVKNQLPNKLEINAEDIRVIIKQAFFNEGQEKMVLVNQNINWENMINVLRSRLNEKLGLEQSSKSAINAKLVLNALQSLLQCSITFTLRDNSENSETDTTELQLECNSTRIKVSLQGELSDIQGNLEYQFSYKQNDNHSLIQIKSEMFNEVIYFFTRKLVEAFNDKVLHYKDVRSNKRVPKVGKWAGTLAAPIGLILGGGVGVVVGNPGMGARFGNTVTDVLGGWIGKRYYLKRVRKVDKVFPESTIETNKLIPYQGLIIHTALEIANIYESQLVMIRLACEDWKIFIEAFALDVVNRIINYIANLETNNLPNFSENNPKPFQNFLVKATLSGTSKKDLVATVIPKKLQKFQSMKSGVHIKEFNWNTSELIRKPGIVNSNLYYRCIRKCNVFPRNSRAKYGFRTFAFYEIENDTGDIDILKKAVLLNTKYTLVSRPTPYHKYRLCDTNHYKQIFDKMFLELVIKQNTADIAHSTNNEVVQTKVLVANVETKVNETNTIVKDICKTVKDLTPLQSKNDQIHSIWLDVGEPTKYFAGRGQKIVDLHNTIQRVDTKLEGTKLTSCITVLTGLGGIGKSELAKQEAISNTHSYDNNVIFVNAETSTSTEISFRKLALKLNITADNIELIIPAVYDKLSNRKSLIIFDNVENKAMDDDARYIYRFFPTSLSPAAIKPYILITSRLSNWEEGIEVVNLEILELGEATNLLLQSCKANLDFKDTLGVESDARQLAERLQCLPLALQQAIAYIKRVDKEIKLATNGASGFGIQDYLEKFEKTSQGAKDLLKFKLPKESLLSSVYTETVFTTWLVTMERIEMGEHGSTALQILQCSSYMVANISVKYFETFVNDKQEVLGSCLNTLLSYSMISLKDGHIEIHRVLQDVIRLRLTEQMSEENLVLRNALCILEGKTLFEGISDRLDCISHTESVWNFVLETNNLELLQEFGNFATTAAEQLAEFDREYASLVFSEQLAQSLKEHSSDSDMYLRPLLLLIKLQLKFNNYFTGPERWIDLFLSLCSNNTIFKGIKFNIMFIRSMAMLVHSLMDIDMQTFNKLMDTVNRANACKDLQCVFKELVNEFKLNQSLSSESKDTATEISAALDIHALIAFTRFPLMTYDYDEEALINALKLFEYLQEKFRNKLKSKPLLAARIYASCSFCWFKLRARPAAVEPLRKCLRLHQLHGNNKDIENSLNEVIRYLRESSGHAIEIENILRQVCFIVKSESNAHGCLDIENMKLQLQQYVISFYQICKIITEN